MFQKSSKHSTFPVAASSLEFARVAESIEDVKQPHVVFKNNYGELNVPVDRFLTGDYVAWQDQNFLSTRQVQLAAAEIVRLGL